MGKDILGPERGLHINSSNAHGVSRSTGCGIKARFVIVGIAGIAGSPFLSDSCHTTIPHIHVGKLIP